MKRFFTVKEVSKILNFSTNTVYKYLEEGKIKSVRVGKEGRFRIPAVEIEKIAPNTVSAYIQTSNGEEDYKKAESSDLQPSLNDRFISIMAIGLGLSEFLFPDYYMGNNFGSLDFALKVAKSLLIVVGASIIVSAFFKTEKMYWHKFIHVLMGIIFAIASVIYFNMNHIPNSILYLSIAITVLINGFLKLNQYQKFSMFIPILIFNIGLSAVILPSSYGNNLFSLIILNNSFVAIAAWATVFLVTVVASFVCSKREGLYSIVYSLVLSSLAIVYSCYAFSLGHWDGATSSIIIAAFSLIFPFWRLFERFFKRPKKQIFITFVWMSTLFLVGYIVLFFVEKSFERYLFLESENRIEAASKIINNFMNENSEKIAAFSQSSDLSSQDTDRILRQFYSSSVGSFRRIILVNKYGKITNTYPYLPDSIGVDISNRDYFTEAKKTHKIYISGIIKPSTQGVPPSLIVSAPLYSPNGDFFGLIGGSADLGYLSDKLSELKFGKGGNFLLVDSKGNYIINPDSSKLLTKADDSTPAAKAVKGESGQIKTYGSSGILSLITYRRVDGENWGLVAEQPFPDAFESYSIFGFVIFSILIICGVGSLILVVYVKNNKSNI
jgi:excisionase family DNA binding protein